MISPGYTISEDGTSLSSSTYHIHALDLRDLASPTNPSALQLERAVDRNLPTLLISECCLVYLPPDQADAVVDYFTKHLFPPSSPSHHPPTNPPSSQNTQQKQTQRPLVLILYEPLHPYDAFGKTMVRNLAARGIVLQTLHRYGSREAQRERLWARGLVGGVGVRTVDEIWEAEPLPDSLAVPGGDKGEVGEVGWSVGIGEKERERVGALEMVDEVEEWRLLAGHYCVAWGWRDGKPPPGEGGGCF